MTLAFAKTEYFTYEPGANNKLHRAQEQVWNIGGGDGDITLYLQGDLPSDMRQSGARTYFAKKHMLTSSTTEFDRQKGKRISNKRNDFTKVTKGGGKDANRYGKEVVLPGGSTFIFCHVLTPDELVTAFYEGLAPYKWAERTFIKTYIDFPQVCVGRVNNSGHLYAKSDRIDIGIIYGSGGRFAIVHGG